MKHLPPSSVTLNCASLHICALYKGRVDTINLPLILLFGGSFCFQVFEA